MLNEIVGNIVGGCFTVVAVFLAWSFERCKLSDQNRAEVRAVVSAIASELSAVIDRYMDVMGNNVSGLKDDEFIKETFKANLNYFSVFEQNGAFIGKISNDKLRTDIVKTYVDAKGLIDGLRIYDESLADYKILLRNAADQKSIEAKEKELVRQSQALKTEQNRVVAVIEKIVVEIGRKRIFSNDDK